jgi:hypothetical protein
MKDQLNLSDKTRLSMPIANLIGIIFLVGSSVLGWSALNNRITALETSDQLMSSDLLKKAEQTPKNLEIYMLIQHNAKQIDKHQKQLDDNIHIKVLLMEAEKKIEKLEKDVENLIRRGN